MPPTPPTPAQLAGARRELARRPAPILADFTLGRLPSPAERAARRVEDLWPMVAAAAGPRWLLRAAAHEPPPGRCRTCLARLAARRHRQRFRLTPAARALLGPACPACRLALTPPTPRRATSRSSTPTRPALSRAQRAERRAAGLQRVVDAALAELAAATATRGRR